MLVGDGGLERWGDVELGVGTGVEATRVEPARPDRSAAGRGGVSRRRSGQHRGASRFPVVARVGVRSGGGSRGRSGLHCRSRCTARRVDRAHQSRVDTQRGYLGRCACDRCRCRRGSDGNASHRLPREPVRVGAARGSLHAALHARAVRRLRGVRHARFSTGFPHGIGRASPTEVAASRARRTRSIAALRRISPSWRSFHPLSEGAGNVTLRRPAPRRSAR